MVEQKNDIEQVEATTPKTEEQNYRQNMRKSQIKKLRML